MFSNIIGYDDIKKTLKRIVDTLNNGEKYKKIGNYLCKSAENLEIQKNRLTMCLKK